MSKQIDREKLLNFLTGLEKMLNEEKNIASNSLIFEYIDGKISQVETTINAIETGKFDAPEASGWVLFLKETPQLNKKVFVLDKNRGNDVGCFDYGIIDPESEEKALFFYGLCCQRYAEEITHWMPLPPAPENG